MADKGQRWLAWPDAKVADKGQRWLVWPDVEATDKDRGWLAWPDAEAAKVGRTGSKREVVGKEQAWPGRAVGEAVEWDNHRQWNTCGVVKTIGMNSRQN